MFNRQALVVVLAEAATVQNATPFMMSSPYSIHHCSLRTTTLSSSVAEHQSEEIDEAYQRIVDATEEDEELIIDIPAMPVEVEPTATPKRAAAKRIPRKKSNPHKELVFSPTAVADGKILGD